MDTNASQELESTVDKLLNSAQDLSKKLEMLKGNYEQDQVRDAQRLRKLERENVELKHALEEHRYGIEVIMNKYRSQVVNMLRLNKLESKLEGKLGKNLQKAELQMSNGIHEYNENSDIAEDKLDSNLPQVSKT